MIDLRVSRTFRLGERRITPMIELFNVTNADTVVGYNVNVGSSVPAADRDPVAEAGAVRVVWISDAVSLEPEPLEPCEPEHYTSFK